MLIFIMDRYARGAIHENSTTKDKLSFAMVVLEILEI